ncbi:hypothetical protein QBC47DRAFT_383714 [Echria macrotheca]|uniref:Uncharacterized protein n=1 Tax=Echria macrotheca TaxID=438768 RepID=A0AAJ0BA99_9PEZI|nr:hypothetical protein QBC47DRAFT_383714 [Echria macrotheca]
MWRPIVLGRGLAHVPWLVPSPPPPLFSPGRVRAELRRQDVGGLSNHVGRHEFGEHELLGDHFTDHQSRRSERWRCQGRRTGRSGLDGLVHLDALTGHGILLLVLITHGLLVLLVVCSGFRVVVEVSGHIVWLDAFGVLDWVATLRLVAVGHAFFQGNRDTELSESLAFSSLLVNEFLHLFDGVEPYPRAVLVPATPKDEDRQLTLHRVVYIGLVRDLVSVASAPALSVYSTVGLGCLYLNQLRMPLWLAVLASSHPPCQQPRALQRGGGRN